MALCVCVCVYNLEEIGVKRRDESMPHWLDKAIKNETIKKVIILCNGEEQLRDTFFSVVSIIHNAIRQT